VLFGVAFGDLEGDLGRRGQTRRVNVVCERRKTRKSSTRRKGRDREKTSNGNGFRGGGAIAGGKKSDGEYADEGGVAMTACTCVQWLLPRRSQVTKLLHGLCNMGRDGAPSA
jgi:hypothetical protein